MTDRGNQTLSPSYPYLCPHCCMQYCTGTAVAAISVFTRPWIVWATENSAVDTLPRSHNMQQTALIDHADEEATIYPFCPVTGYYLKQGSCLR